MEEVQVFLALLSQLTGDVSMFANVILHSVANQWLSRKFDGCKFADALVNKVLAGILLVDKSLS